MFFEAPKPMAPGRDGVEFTAADLNKTIALYRRTSAAESRITKVINQSLEDARSEHYGRLPRNSQGPHSPTD